MATDDIPYEALSRLLDGDLPEDQAAPLRERLRSDPACAEAYAEIEAVVDALEGLPMEQAPPPLKDSVFPEGRRPVRVATWAPWMLVAAAVLALILRGGTPEVEVQLMSGESWLEGDLNLVAGDVEIALDGRARILVEPFEPRGREGEQIDSESPMKTSLLAGAVVGALVTVTVYEGSARVSSPEADAVDVLPGTPQTFGSAASTTKAPRVAGTPSALENRMAALKEEMEAVKSELQRERFAGALVRGQLSAERGEPVDWTDRVAPESFRPEQFEAALEKQLSELPDFEIGEIRCEEYPCVAAVRYTGDRETEQWQEPFGERIEDWTDAVFGGKRSMSMNTSRFQNDDRDERYVIFGAFEGDGDLAVKERTDWRIDELVDEIGEAVAERAQP